MKKLLSTLGALSMTTPIVITTMAAQSIDKNSLEKVNYSLGGFKNIVKILNQKDNPTKNLDSKEVDSLLDNIVPNFYFDSINDKQGRALVWKGTPQNDTKVVKTYSNTYVNNSPFDQKTLTQSRTEEVTESHNFSISLTENIVAQIENKISSSFLVPMGKVTGTVKFNFGFDIGSKQEWSDTTINSTKETVPSQEIIQSAHSILYVKYIISQGTTKYDGIVQFRLNNFEERLFRIPFFYFNAQGKVDYRIWKRYSTNDILKTLRDLGYQEQLTVKNTNEYSILSVDNIDNPKDVFINLPLSWTSEDSGIRLEHYEEKI